MPGSGRSRRHWGWHRLVDEWAERVVDAAHVRPGELVFDIGAGEGALTTHLLDAGARVIAVELHPDRAQRLRERFAASALTVVHTDAANLRLPRRPFRVVASPPYGISSRLLRQLLARRSALTAADLVLQRAVVRRYTEGYAPGARRWLQQFEVQPGLALPRRAFLPRPNVDSGVLVIRRNREPVRALWTHDRGLAASKRRR